MQRHQALHWAVGAALAAFHCVLCCHSLIYLQKFCDQQQFQQHFTWRRDSRTGCEHAATSPWSVSCPEGREPAASTEKLGRTGERRWLMPEHSLRESEKQCKPGTEQGLRYFTCYECRSQNRKAINYISVLLTNIHRVRTVYRQRENNGSLSNRVIFQIKQRDLQASSSFPCTSWLFLYIL